MTKFFVLSLSVLMISLSSYAENVLIQVVKDDEDGKESKYDYVYYNPPRKSIQVAGRYVVSSSGVRYVHSSSKHKRAAHAARINAYNYEYGNY